MDPTTHLSTSLLPPRIILPDEMTAVVGDTLQVFVRGAIEAQNPYNLPYVMDGPLGGQSYPRYLEFTPVVADAGRTYPLTVNVHTPDYHLLATCQTKLKVVQALRQPAVNKNVLCLGDSITNPGIWPTEMFRRLTGSGGTPAGHGFGNITFLGDMPMHGYRGGYSGYGGWSYSTFTGASGQGHVLTAVGHDKDRTDAKSIWQDADGKQWVIVYAHGGLKIAALDGVSTLPAPSGMLTHVSGAAHTSAISYTAAAAEPASCFWDAETNTFSFTQWCRRNGFSGIDALYVLLGWNGLPYPTANLFDPVHHTLTIGHAQTLIDKFHAEYPSAVVRVLGVQIPSVTGGLGASYGADAHGLSAYYAMVRTLNGLRLAYQAMVNQAAYHGYCRYLDVASQFDSEYNMPQSAHPVNTRNACTEMRGTDGAHPEIPGYYQIADIAYRDFIRTYCSS